MKTTPNKEYILAGNAAADVTGSEIFTDNVVGLSFIAKFSGGGSPQGVLYIQGTNDDGNETDSETIWANITSKAVNGDGNYFVENTEWLYRRARLFYDVTSGTGTLKAQSLTKGF